MFRVVSRNFVAARHPFRERVPGCIQSTGFGHRNHFFIFRNEHAQSTTLGPKLMFGVLSPNFIAARHPFENGCRGAYKARVLSTGTISSFFATNMPNPLLLVQNSCLGVVTRNFIAARHPFQKRVSGFIQSTSFGHRNHFFVFCNEHAQSTTLGPNKPIKSPRKGSNRKEQNQPKAALVWRTGQSGVPPDSVRCTREINYELLSFGFLESRSAIIHRTVRCAKRSTGHQRNGRVQRSADNATVRGQHARSQSRCQKVHRTVNSACPVHHQTVRWPSLSELQRSNPNGWVTWLAHRTVQCAHRQTVSPTTILVGGAINIPQPPHFKASKFFRLHIQYKS
jgi:hypothetical protein